MHRGLLIMTKTRPEFDELQRQIRESLESSYARESTERKRVREKNREQMEVALLGGDELARKTAPRRQ